MEKVKNIQERQQEAESIFWDIVDNCGYDFGPDTYFDYSSLKKDFIFGRLTKEEYIAQLKELIKGYIEAEKETENDGE